MNVLVNGIGNIGTSLLNLLVKYKNLLEIENIFALKKTINKWNLSELDILKEKGIHIFSISDEDSFININDIKSKINYIFDCNANSMGLDNKLIYDSYPSLIACSAQGSEKGFGIPYMAGINDEIIRSKKFTQIVSCNTHSLCSLLYTFSGFNFNNIVSSDFVIVRRSEDISNHQRLVSANVVSRHLNSLGTHHAIDVNDLIQTINQKLEISSSDITTPSQLMHSVRFNIKLSEKVEHSLIEKRIQNNTLISTTNKFDSNVIFELGRRYGFNGRLYSHAIVINNNMLIDNDTIKGWAFIPQEGNTLLSTIKSFLLQTDSNNSNDIINKISKELIRAEY